MSDENEICDTMIFVHAEPWPLEWPSYLGLYAVVPQMLRSFTEKIDFARSLADRFVHENELTIGYFAAEAPLEPIA